MESDFQSLRNPRFTLLARRSKGGFAQALRREMTEAEEKLWRELRGRRLDRIKFRRQELIGKYVANFVYFEAKLLVEIDGSQHAESVHDNIGKADL